MTEGVYMTQKELKRAAILGKVGEKRLTQTQAAEELDLSLRQLQRLFKLYRKHGATALASKKRGKPSNNQLSPMLVAQIEEIITCELYDGFKPTFMCEKLKERHEIKVSPETVRKLMIQNGLWKSRQEKRPVVHQQRQRRARKGELVQADGSPHAWFENRGTPCGLLVFIDDASGRTYGKFVAAESCLGYMQTTTEYIKKYGIPLAMYVDRHSIFRINKGDNTQKPRLTQFGRALKELGVELIYANTPQAKGRVERANKTLQDRLVHELRLAGISTMEEGNKFLETYWEDHNRRFSVMPESPKDAHRKLDDSIDLNRVLCEKHDRVISKNLEIFYENGIYQITLEKPCRSLKGAKVTVLKHQDGTLSFEYKGQPLPVRKFGELQTQGPELSAKELDHFLEALQQRANTVTENHSQEQVTGVKACEKEHQPRKARKVPQSHPWKQVARAAMRVKAFKARNAAVTT